jgi:hypothetical protein
MGGCEILERHVSRASGEFDAGQGDTIRGWLVNNERGVLFS